jgi:hypothetical protein
LFFLSPSHRSLSLSFGAFAQSPVPGRGQLLVASALENHLYSTNVNAGIITSIDMQVKTRSLCSPYLLPGLFCPWLCTTASPLCQACARRPPPQRFELDLSLHKPCWPYYATFRAQLRTPIAELFIHVV